MCVGAAKGLLALRLDGLWPNLSILGACAPIVASAVLRIVLHIAKTPLPRHAPMGSAASRRCTWLRRRPGTPFNPSNMVILLIAVRADGWFASVSWTLTLAPLLVVFAFFAAAR